MGLLGGSQSQKTTNLPLKSLLRTVDKTAPMYNSMLTDVMLPRAGITMSGGSGYGQTPSFSMDQEYMSPFRRSSLAQGKQAINMATNRNVRSSLMPYDLGGAPGMALAAKQRAEQMGLRNLVGFETEQMGLADDEQNQALQQLLAMISGGMDYGRGFGTTTTESQSNPGLIDTIGGLASGYLDMQTNKKLAKLMGEGSTPNPMGSGGTGASGSLFKTPGGWGGNYGGSSIWGGSGPRTPIPFFNPVTGRMEDANGYILK